MPRLLACNNSSDSRKLNGLHGFVAIHCAKPANDAVVDYNSGDAAPLADRQTASLRTVTFRHDKRW